MYDEQYCKKLALTFYSNWLERPI